MLTKEELLKFEEEIKDLFLDKKILAPVHLTKGNEEQLIEIFKDIKKNDWVFSTHRSHYHALLKGVGKEWLKNEILERRSISIHNKEYKFFSSAIVAGVIPIAVGAAFGIKRQKKKDMVWVFIGDMAAEMGIAYECMKYAGGFNLPIVFVVEDNGVSVDTPTQKVWGESGKKAKIIRYKYERGYPHQGCGMWVTF